VCIVDSSRARLTIKNPTWQHVGFFLFSNRNKRDCYTCTGGGEIIIATRPILTIAAAAAIRREKDLFIYLFIYRINVGL
jgi:hypothetical protein